MIKHAATKANDWINIKGDGTDTFWPALWKPFEARLRCGTIWTDLSITPFCLNFTPGEYWRHGDLGGNPRANDVMQVRLLNDVDGGKDQAA